MEITELPPTPVVLPAAGELVHIRTQEWALERWEGQDPLGLAVPWARKRPATASHLHFLTLSAPQVSGTGQGARRRRRAPLPSQEKWPAEAISVRRHSPPVSVSGAGSE